MSTARKDDTGKMDYSLIPLVALDAEAKAFMVGLKYGRYNYCGGMEASRVFRALIGHAYKWFNGEENDPQDGQPHLGAVRACAAMLLRMQELETLVDNRYKNADKKR